MNRIAYASLAVTAAALIVVGCTSMSTSSGPTDAEVATVLKESFSPKSVAKLDRLEQSEMQKTCTAFARSEVPKDVAEGIQKAQLARVKYPSDGKFLGDFKTGEKIAQSGRGLQFSDNEKTVSGGNCYACHQVSKQELAHGNIGPSLYNYGKLRGYTDETRKYTWAKIWNSHAFVACSNMPRFGDAGILTEQQIKDVMALLLDPNSPVNKD